MERLAGYLRTNADDTNAVAHLDVLHLARAGHGDTAFGVITDPSTTPDGLDKILANDDIDSVVALFPDRAHCAVSNRQMLLGFNGNAA